jgi:hypothetical protein
MSTPPGSRRSSPTVPCASRPPTRSRHIKAYRQDFAAIAALLAGNANRIGNLTPADITADRMRSAFATYADAHEPSSIRRCWPTWNPERDVPGVPRPGPGPVVASHKRIPSDIRGAERRPGAGLRRHTEAGVSDFRAPCGSRSARRSGVLSANDGRLIGDTPQHAC